MYILITGASQGIGREIVKNLAIKGHHIFALSRNEEKLKSLVQECKSLNKTSRVESIPYDITKLRSGEPDFIKKLKSKLPSLNILINNAGFLSPQDFQKTSYETLTKTIGVNFTAPYLLIQHLLPLLRTSENAHIVNIGSMGGVNGSAKFPGLSAYSASKGALAILTECLAEELKSENVSCNYLALGAVQTEMLKKAFPGYTAPISADKMAEFIVDFALNGQRYFNGKVIPVSISTP